VPPELHGLDPEFYEAFRQGEEQAFDRVFRAYHGPLTYYAFKFLGDEKMAEDVVQDCFTELWVRRKKLSGVQSINSYLYRCVYNHCADLFEKMQRQKGVTGSLPETEEANLLESETMARILRVIDHLPLRMQQVLRMHYLEDKSLEEIGHEIGIDPETARSHRYRAIQLLKKTIITG